MATDPADREPALAGRPGPVRPSPLTSGSAHGCNAELRARLRRLGADRLAEILLRLSDSRGEETRLLVDDLLRRFAGPAAPSPAQDAEPAMVGSSPAMQQVYGSIRKFAATNAAVLISGESGTGKALAARAIHERSAYRGGPFVAINCAALPATVIAAELFGHEKAAFTGAMQRRVGRLESADGGTIFFDEIGDLPLEQQAHLLRFLQERAIDRGGGTRPVSVDARVICATNIDLPRAIRDGRFREDLYYCLHVLNLHLPSLRERGGDIELLATFFLRKFAAEHGRDIEGFGDDAWRRMRAHPWPGNVRELISRVRRAVVISDDAQITAQDLGIDQSESDPPPAAPRLAPRGPRLDETQLRTALRQSDSVTSAARALGVSRMTIYRTMRRYGIT